MSVVTDEELAEGMRAAQRVAWRIRSHFTRPVVNLDYEELCN